MTSEAAELFRKATRTQYSKGLPPTFATTFRKAEFEFLDRFEVDMRELLHLDQEYEFHAPLAVGDIPKVTTKIGEIKERRGMYFVSLQSEVTCLGVQKVSSNTTFVVRTKA